MPTLNGISFEHLHDGSGAGTYDEKGRLEITEKYQIAYTDLPNFLSALRGTWASLGGSQVQFTQPDRHHVFSSLFCLRASFEPVGEPSTSGDNLTWDFAIVSAVYGTPTFNPTATDVSDIAEESLEFGVRVVTLPSGSMKTATGASGKKINYGITKIIPTAEYTLTIQGVPLPPGGTDEAPFSRIFSAIGKVNAASWNGADAETLLFMGGKANRKYTSAGAQDWNVTYVMKYDSGGWNSVYADDGTKVTAYATGDETKLYSTTDFDTLMPGAV